MKKIDTVQIVRNIRDRQNKDIKDKSPQEIIDYFRKKAIKINKNVETTQLSMR
jgi:hypothetical protein